MEPHIAAPVVEWLGLHQYAVLGTELWVIRKPRLRTGILQCVCAWSTISVVQRP
jgi:hypothetical protein